MTKQSYIMPLERVEKAILLIRGQKVLLDTDLARLYEVSTKRLNEQVKRNRSRFPGDFMFQLTQVEKDEVVANCDHLKVLKFSSTLPYAFTEHGALMLASVLNSTVAVNVSIHIVRAFIRLRNFLATHRELAEKLLLVEKSTDFRFQQVFRLLRSMDSPRQRKKKERIGFHGWKERKTVKNRVS